MKRSYEEAYLQVYTAIVAAMTSRLPFGVVVDEDTAQGVIDEAEELTDLAMAKLLENAVIQDESGDTV